MLVVLPERSLIALTTVVSQDDHTFPISLRPFRNVVVEPKDQFCAAITSLVIK